MDKQIQTEQPKNSKPLSLYSTLIQDFSTTTPDYFDRKKVAYQQTSIKYFDKIRYLTKSYILPTNLLDMPTTTEEELLSKYDIIKKYVDNIKLDRLKNGKNEENKRIKYSKKNAILN